jgi:hypothetical protein
LASWKLWKASPICLRLFWHWLRAAASRTFLYRGQQQADEDRDDGDHHQQLDEREPGPTAGHGDIPRLGGHAINPPTRPPASRRIRVGGRSSPHPPGPLTGPTSADPGYRGFHGLSNVSGTPANHRR